MEIEHKIGVVLNNDIKVDPHHGRYIDELIALPNIPGFTTIRVYLDRLTIIPPAGTAKTMYEKRFGTQAGDVGYIRDAVAEPQGEQERLVPRYDEIVHSGPSTTVQTDEPASPPVVIHANMAFRDIDGGNYVEVLVGDRAFARVYLDDIDYVKGLKETIKRQKAKCVAHERMMDDLDILEAAQARIENRIRDWRRTHTSRKSAVAETK